MATAARDRLARVLRGDAKSSFSAELTTGAEGLRLAIDGCGRIRFPVRPAQSRKLIALGQPAWFGQGEQTLTDAGVRDTWEIPRHLVRAEWDPAAVKDTLATVKEELGLPTACELTVDLHSLLVYEPGQFFVAHQDSEKDDAMVGTLVVTLPSAYSGDELVVEHNGERKAYGRPWEEPSVVAFYADCRHEVLPVKSGYRITLTYNLLLHGDTSRAEGDAGTVAELTALLREHFATPVPRDREGILDDPPNRLVYLLDHEYTQHSLDWTRLKGADARRVQLLRAAAERAGCEADLALADVRTTHGAFPEPRGYAFPEPEDYGYPPPCPNEDEAFDDGAFVTSPSDTSEPDDSPSDDRTLNDRPEETSWDSGDCRYQIRRLLWTGITLAHWTRPDGSQPEQASLVIGEHEACTPSASGDLKPYFNKFEGYMGNDGNTLDRWYHRAAVVVWPRTDPIAPGRRSPSGCGSWATP